MPQSKFLSFKFLSSEVKLVKFILESNGFQDISQKEEQISPLILWSNSMIKSAVYQ